MRMTLKIIQLKILRISYDGDSIGRDIRVDVEALGRFLRIDKRIKVGETYEVNNEVGKFETDRSSFEVGVTITAVEKDLLFNDVGIVNKDIAINTAVIKPQQFTFEIKLKESRSILSIFWGKKIAVLKIVLEAIASDKIKYVSELDESQGFLKIVLENNGAEESLSEYLQVQIEERSDYQREYFTILEGPHRGRLASVKLPPDTSSYFTTDIKHGPIIRAKYSISRKIFTLKGRNYEADDDTDTPWQKGTYDIEIPDYPHELGKKYLNQSKRALTWFRIGHSGERYLHTGSISAGCITIVEVSRWMEVYNELINARKGDFMSVGVLEVID